jgi:hypothetical protein
MVNNESLIGLSRLKIAIYFITHPRQRELAQENDDSSC